MSQLTYNNKFIDFYINTVNKSLVTEALWQKWLFTFCWSVKIII